MLPLFTGVPVGTTCGHCIACSVCHLERLCWDVLRWRVAHVDGQQFSSVHRKLCKPPHGPQCMLSQEGGWHSIACRTEVTKAHSRGNQAYLREWAANNRDQLHGYSVTQLGAASMHCHHSIQLNCRACCTLHKTTRQHACVVAPPCTRILSLQTRVAAACAVTVLSDSGAHATSYQAAQSCRRQYAGSGCLASSATGCCYSLPLTV